MKKTCVATSLRFVQIDILLFAQISCSWDMLFLALNEFEPKNGYFHKTTYFKIKKQL